MRTLLIAALFALAASPALAQFPPPGIYLCIVADGTPYGTWNLFVAGDYEFTSEAGVSGTGQVSSAGDSVEALSGPLKDIHAKGTFVNDEASGEAKFTLSSDAGELRCGLPPE